MNRHLRLFTAVMPSAAERQAMEALRRQWPGLPARLRPVPGRLHMTLQFVARWPAARLVDWQAALAPLRFAPFEVRWTRSQVWGQGAQRLLVLRPDANEALQALHAATEALAREAGLPWQARRWRPHVTVWRGVPAAHRPPIGLLAQPLCWRVDAVSLVCSDLEAQPPRYRILGRYGGAAHVS